MGGRVAALDDRPGPGSQVAPRLGPQVMRHDPVDRAHPHSERRRVLRRAATAAARLVLPRWRRDQSESNAKNTLCECAPKMSSPPSSGALRI